MSIALIVGLIIACSWMSENDRLPNINTYHLHIGKKLIFSTTVKNNKLGDTVIVSRKICKASDTLAASVFLCGAEGINAKVALIIKDEQGKIISERSHIVQQFGYGEKMAIADILRVMQPADKKIIGVYFAIDNKRENFNTSFLIAWIRFE